MIDIYGELNFNYSSSSDVVVNPLTGGLKFLSTTLLNSLVALLFFLVAGHFASPSFVGKVAIIQLVETITSSFFSALPFQLVTREVAHYYASSQDYTKVIHTSLTYSLLISPFFLFLLLFPSYLWLSIPYFIIYLYTSYQFQLLSGLGKFGEANVGSVIFTLTRWGLSIIAVLYHSVELLIIIWIVGALVKAIYYQRFLPLRFYIDWQIFNEIVKVGFPIYITGIVNFISSQGDRVVTAFLLGSYELGIYQLVALAAIVPSMLIFSFSNSLIPSSTYYYVKGRDMREMSSTALRIISLVSLPIAILGYAISPIFILKLFPQYVSGIESMQLLVLFLTATMPLQLLSTFMVAAKVSYRPFILIGSLSAIEVVSLSYVLIPRLGILGAAIAQVVNALLTSALYLLFSVKQNIFPLGRREVVALVLTALSFLSLFNWLVALILVLLGFRLLGVVSTSEVKIVEDLAPQSLKRFAKVLYLVASDRSVR